MKYILWYVDEDPEDASLNRRELQHLLDPSTQVRAICPPLDEVSDYLPYLQEPATLAFVIDQRLMTDGTQVKYEGIQLAKYLRSVNLAMPIFLLTNFAGDSKDFPNDLWNIEDVIDKEDLIKYEENPEARMRIARFSRHLNSYKYIIDERQQRLGELLRKTMSEQLTREELDELDKLQFHRSLPTLAEEALHIRELQEVLEEHQRLVDLFEKRNRLDGDLKTN